MRRCGRAYSGGPEREHPAWGENSCRFGGFRHGVFVTVFLRLCFFGYFLPDMTIWDTSCGFCDDWCTRYELPRIEFVPRTYSCYPCCAATATLGGYTRWLFLWSQRETGCRIFAGRDLGTCDAVRVCCSASVCSRWDVVLTSSVRCRLLLHMHMARAHGVLAADYSV